MDWPTVALYVLAGLAALIWAGVGMWDATTRWRWWVRFPAVAVVALAVVAVVLLP